MKGMFLLGIAIIVLGFSLWSGAQESEKIVLHGKITAACESDPSGKNSCRDATAWQFPNPGYKMRGYILLQTCGDYDESTGGHEIKELKDSEDNIIGYELAVWCEGFQDKPCCIGQQMTISYTER